MIFFFNITPKCHLSPSFFFPLKYKFEFQNKILFLWSWADLMRYFLWRIRRHFDSDMTTWFADFQTSGHAASTVECCDHSYQVAPYCPEAGPDSRRVILPWLCPQCEEREKHLRFDVGCGQAQRMKQWREKNKHLDGVELNGNLA